MHYFPLKFVFLNSQSNLKINFSNHAYRNHKEELLACRINKDSSFDQNGDVQRAD